ncbi:hypothetical protein [Sodalis sp. (in: enterobacteria)]|uniref:hypothetical protein n=1 Tax=Sodalis sp. (in: enterobacteria) TaxID=1898979 RepID=UPI003F3E3843
MMTSLSSRLPDDVYKYFLDRDDMNKESPSRTIVIITALFAALCGLYLLNSCA